MFVLNRQKIIRRFFIAFLSLAVLCSGLFFAPSATATVKNTSSDTAVLSSNNPLLPVIKKTGNSPMEQLSNLPSSYSTTNLTSVKDQGSNKLCWTFSALGGLEAYLLNHNYGEFDFSEQHLNLWATDKGNGTGWSGRNPGEGGWAEISCGYLISWQGPVSEEAVPYDGGSPTVPNGYDSAEPLIGVTGIKMLDSDRDSIKQTIMDYSAVCCSYNSSIVGDNSTMTAYYSPELEAPDNGHAICIVGWDDNYSKENFGRKNTPLRPKKDGAWLAKNSWGDSYNSLGGYFWISYEDYYLFNGDYGRTYAYTSVQNINDNTFLYQREIYGATYTFPIPNDHNMSTTDCTFANLYDFSDKYSVLDKIIFYSENAGASYYTYYIPTDGNTINRDTDSWVLLSSGTVPYSGYICDDINDYKVPSGIGAIGIHLVSANGTSIAIGVDEWMTDITLEKYYFTPGAKHGISYLINSEYGCLDLMDAYKNNGDELGGLFSIKIVAETDNRQEPEYKRGDVNLDNIISMLDVVMIQRHIAGLITLTDNQLNAADSDSNTQISMLDVIFVQQVIAGLIE